MSKLIPQTTYVANLLIHKLENGKPPIVSTEELLKYVSDATNFYVNTYREELIMIPYGNLKDKGEEFIEYAHLLGGFIPLVEKEVLRAKFRALLPYEVLKAFLYAEKQIDKKDENELSL